MKTAIAALLTGATLFAGLSVATPAAAQARDRVLVIYGDDKCPSSGGEEIVVCARKPESERYRIPEELRSAGSSLPGNWRDQAKSLEYVGQSGIESCSPVGSGGASGCFVKLARQARAERKAAAAAERDRP